MTSTRPIALASSSPRRRELLSSRGVSFDVISSGLDDAVLRKPAACAPEAWVMGLAYLKAAAGARSLSDHDVLIIGADTIVAKDDQIIGQPRDARDAERIVRALSGGAHRVLTGVAVVRAGERRDSREVFFDVAHVNVGEIPESEIVSYIESGDWRGKAGAYNLRERLDAGWPIRFEGDAGTIMGLPVDMTLERLARLSGPATESLHA